MDIIRSGWKNPDNIRAKYSVPFQVLVTTMQLLSQLIWHSISSDSILKYVILMFFNQPATCTRISFYKSIFECQLQFISSLHSSFDFISRKLTFSIHVKQNVAGKFSSIQYEIQPALSLHVTKGKILLWRMSHSGMYQYDIREPGRNENMQEGLPSILHTVVKMKCVYIVPIHFYMLSFLWIFHRRVSLIAGGWGGGGEIKHSPWTLNWK